MDITPRSSALATGATLQFSATIAGRPAKDVRWHVNNVEGGSSTTGTISSSGTYVAPALATPSNFLISASTDSGLISEYSVVTVLSPGSVTPTAHPLVANYAIGVPAGGRVQIRFGMDTNYGRTTWEQRPPAGGGVVEVLVAGMTANTLYHMQAVVRLAGGKVFRDGDHTFVTGSIPVSRLPNLLARTTPGQVPQPGIELVNVVDFGVAAGIQAIVSDLNGNVIWYYDPALPIAFPTLNPIKLLPNGHFVVNYSGGPADGDNSVMQEVDLAGNVVWQMTHEDLNQALAASSCAGCKITVTGTHHDFAVLPNGHLIVIAGEQIFFPSLPGFPSGTNVLGDVLIDLDQNHKPVWIWSAFDHLDVNRHLMGLPDWTHTNSVVYSPDDHNLVISVRHQSWVIKIDYNDGKGTGNIQWRLGYEGDFTLLNGIDPIDWQAAQHDFNIIGPASAGIFDGLVFDNGDLRVLDPRGDTCGPVTPCYSRAVIFHVDQNAKTASLAWADTLADYSFFGGSARLLANGNVEYDECDGPGPGPDADVREVTRTSPPQTVWELEINQYAYRAFRIPSLYPGIQW